MTATKMLLLAADYHWNAQGDDAAVMLLSWRLRLSLDESVRFCEYRLQTWQCRAAVPRA
jgi:hypothetical protein